MLTKQDLTPPEKPKLSGHERRELKKKEDADIEQVKEYGQQMQDLVREFFNDKIVPLQIPMIYLEEGLPKLILALLKIYQGKSEQYKKAMELKEKMEKFKNLTCINDLDICE